MKRREFFQLASLFGLSVSLPAVTKRVHAEGVAYEGPLFLSVGAAGGWDTTLLFDPKGIHAGKAINRAYENAQRSGPFSFAPVVLKDGADRLDSPEDFLTKYGRSLLVVHGIETGTVNHETGVKAVFSGRATDELPSIAALLAAEATKKLELPLAYVSAGDGTAFDTTHGLVPVARASLAQLRAISHPNRPNPDDDKTRYHSEATRARIVAARDARLLALTQGATLPDTAAAMSLLARARLGSPAFPAFADKLPAASVKLGDVFPSLGASASRFRDLESAMQQAELMLLGFRHGVAVSGSLGIGGFDTHRNHDVEHAARLGRLLLLLRYILDTAATLGISERLVVFVGSDFGRTPTYNAENGKDHWPTTSALVFGPGVIGNRVVGATDGALKPLRVDPTDPSRTLGPDDKTGTLLRPEHVHSELRRVLGLAGTDLDKRFALPAADPIRLFG